MALQSQIEQASRTEKRPVGIPVFDRTPYGPKVDDEDRRKFAVGLCDVAIRHTCTAEPGEPCVDPVHAQDRDDARTALILAGLIPDPFPSKDANRSVSRDVTPLPEVARARRRREAEAKNPPAPLPDLTWQLKASCRGEDADLFYAPDSEPARKRIVREARAIAVCMGCPVVSACLDYALEKREQGVWGGTTDGERTNLRRRRTWRAKAA